MKRISGEALLLAQVGTCVGFLIPVFRVEAFALGAGSRRSSQSFIYLTPFDIYTRRGYRIACSSSTALA
jgi:hypothetical protein